MVLNVPSVGSLVPARLSRHLLPLVPGRFQRFEATDSWEQAAQRVSGYEAVPVPPPPRSGLAAGLVPSGNELILMTGLQRLHAHLGSPSTLRVVDLGGARGDSSVAARTALPNVDISWTVVELPAAVGVLKDHGRDDVRYTDDLDAELASGADVTVASALLNYVPDPDTTLNLLADTSRSSLLLRLPLWPTTSHQSAAQRPNRADRSFGYPTWFFSDQEFRHGPLARGTLLMDVESRDDRAYFAGHYGFHRALAVTWT